MPLSGSAFWAVILPIEKTTIVSNPSFERGTAGWGTIQAGTIGTTSQFQQFGAWSGSVAPTSNGTTGAIGPTFTAGNGTAYTFSAYVRGQSGIAYKIGVGDSNGVNLVGSTNFTGGGTWHRYVGSWTEASGATRRMVIQKNADADTNAFYIDGAMVEVGSLTTYFDGDQEGCIWYGEPHASPSLRSGTFRGGGSVIALADLGLKPDQYPGVGMPPLDVTMQSYALLPGGEYQRSRAEERPFTLSFSPIQGTTLQGLHTTRRTLLNVFKPDLVSPQQPIRFWYTGGQGTVQIDAVYQSGLDFGDLEGPMAENGAVKFTADDPYWYATTNEGTALASRVGIGSANFLAKRDPLGRWGTTGANGSATEAAINALSLYNGTLYLGGAFGSTAGTRSGGLSFYNTQANTFGTFGGTVDGVSGINAITVDPLGTVIFGGGFTNISGLSNTRFIARYANGFATITGGTVSNTVRAFAWNNGTLFIGGAFNAVGGTSNTGGLLMWRPAGYGTTSNGTMNTDVFGVGAGLDNKITTTVQAAASPGGTSVNYVAQYFGSWGTMNTGFSGGGVGGAQGVAIGPNGYVYVVGGFGSAGGGSAQNAAYWNGQQWFPMAGGIADIGAGGIQVTSAYADQLTGDVYATGLTGAQAGGRPLPDQMARWNSYVWLPLDIDLQTGQPSSLLLGPDRTTYLAGAFTGIAQAAAVAQLVNTGMGDAYPIVKLRNTSAGTVRLYQLGNTLTGDMLYFNMTFEPGEELTLVTEPGNRSFTSSFAGNVFGKILGGSNITGFRLLSGTNYISLFCDSGSVAASIYWRPRSDSIDGGTIY